MRPKKRYLLALLGVLLLPALSFSGGSISTNDPGGIFLGMTVHDPDFDVNVSPGQRTIDAGDDTHYNVVVKFEGDFEGPVNLSISGLPAGATGSFDDNPVWRKGTAVETKLRITTKKDTPPGEYTLIIEGYNKELGTREDTVKLKIKGTQGFHLEASPTTVTIEPGETAEYDITAVFDQGFQERVELSVSGVPTDASFTIDPKLLCPSQDKARLVITTKSTIKEGTYEITVKGKGKISGIVSEVVVKLSVGVKPPEEQGNLTIDKSVAPSKGDVGSILVYTLRIKNNGSGDVTGVVVRDNLPTGFGYVKGSTIISGRPAADPSGSGTLTWKLGELNGGSSIKITYHVVIKGSVRRGTNTNTAIVTGTDRRGVSLSARDTADVAVSWESVERRGKIKGRVFHDENKNRIKNADESGVSGVTVILETGDKVVTDDNGDFLFESVRPGEHLVGVDVRRLPENFYMNGSESEIVSVSWGGTSRVNFALGYTPPPEPEKPEVVEEVVKEEVKKEEKKKKEEKPLLEPGKVSGRVFIDEDGDGLYDIGEEGAGGVYVLLDGKIEVKTDIHGKYIFENVPAGTHNVSLYGNKEFKEKYRQIKKDKIKVSVKSGVNSKVDVPVSEAKGIRVDIELTVEH